VLDRPKTNADSANQPVFYLCPSGVHAIFQRPGFLNHGNLGLELDTFRGRLIELDQAYWLVAVVLMEQGQRILECGAKRVYRVAHAVGGRGRGDSTKYAPG